MQSVYLQGGSKLTGTPVTLPSNVKTAREFPSKVCADSTCSDAQHDNTSPCVAENNLCVEQNIISTDSRSCNNDVNNSIKDKSFSFLHWNVQGIFGKLFDADFMSFISTFDFVCLVETFVEEISSTSFPGYKPVCVPAVKLSTQGRRSGGVICLIKNDLLPFVKEVDIKSNICRAFIIKKELFGTLKDVLYVTCYIQPEKSPFYAFFDCENGIALLEEYLTDCLLTYGDLCILLCGDLNSRTANFSHYCQGDTNLFDFQYTSHPPSKDRHSQDEVLNNYGKLMLNMCTAMDLCIVNGMCYGDQNGCYTFVSDRGCSVNDYFMMSCELFSAWSDMCELRVCERIESDHMPIRLCFKPVNDQYNDLPLCNQFIEKFVWNDDFASLYEENICGQDLGEKLSFAVSQIDVDIDNALHMFNYCVIEAAECMKKQVRTKKTYGNRDWFDLECRHFKKDVRRLLNKFRRTLDASDRDNYCIKRREYKHLLKRKQKKVQNELLNELLSSIKSQKTFWNTIHKISSNKRQPVNNISSDDWFVHFKELLTKETNVDDSVPLDRGVEEEIVDNMNRPISKEEVLLAVRKIKNKKAAGPDGIIGELLKYGCKSDLFVSFFVRFFNSLFDKGVYPEQWTESIVLTLYKKGDVNNPHNYRGISLSDASSKLYSTIINLRLQEWVTEHNITGEFQAGFKRDYSTIDHMFTLMAFIQKQFSLNRKLYVAFIDFEKAFDTVNRSILWPILLKTGIKGKLFRSIKSMYHNVKARIRCGGKLTDYINCTSGVKQGDVCSPVLFSLFINELTSEVIAQGRHGAQFTTEILQLFILLLADDVALISETVIGLQTQLTSLNRAATRLQLKVNMQKSNIIVFRKGGHLSKWERWTYNGSVLPVVNMYKYLGIYFTTRLSFNPTCKDLASKAKRAVLSIRQKLSMIDCESFKVFVKLFDSQVQPIVQYGSELWGLENAADHCEKVHLFALKKFLRVSVQTPNDLVYGETNRFPIYINSVVRCIKYWLKLTQMDETRLPKKAYNMLCDLDVKGKSNWATKVKVKLHELGMGFVWLNQGVGDMSWFMRELRSRLIDSRWQVWDAHVQDSERFNLYRQFNSLHCVPAYITMKMDRHLKFIMTRFRFGISDILVHRLRYKNATALDLICPLCNNDCETDIHLVFHCPALADLRNQFIPSKFYNHPSLFKLVMLMSSTHEFTVKQFAIYLYKVFQLRSICCS